MKKIILFLFACTVSVAWAESIRVATWNIRCVEKKDSLEGNAWSKRAPQIAHEIQYQNFEILGLQEVDSVQKENLQALLPEYAWVEEDSVVDNSILYLPERFEVQEHGIFWYSKSGLPEKSWDAKFARYCNWAKFLDKESNKILYVFNSHFDHKGDTARVESAKIAAQKVEEIAQNHEVIFMGDLNTKLKRKPLKILEKEGKMHQALDSAGVVYFPNGSFTKFHMNTFSETTIDHIFYKGKMKVLRYGILTDVYYDGETFRYPSDHLPAVVEIKMK